MTETTISFFSGEDLKSILTMNECIEAMAQAFTYLSTGEARMPLRTALELEADNATSLFMPAYLPVESKVGIKTVNTNRNNPTRGLPLIHAMLMVFDAATGVPLAVMDAEHITAMRTGAVSGLATRLLSRPDSSTVAIIGTGTQGATQLEAVATVRNIKKVLVYDISTERASAFSTKMAKKLDLDVSVATSMDALKKVDIICTSTSSTTPVFTDSSLSEGTHINGVGSFKPTMAEIPPETISRSKVVVDQMEGCLAEAGDIIQPLQSGLITKDFLHGELGDVVTGKITSREQDDEITVFKSVGVAVQDLMTADLALKLAATNDIGTSLKL